MDTNGSIYTDQLETVKDVESNEIDPVDTEMNIIKPAESNLEETEVKFEQ